MTRDEIERCDRYLRQGLTLDRELQRALVDFALGNTAPQHPDGCGWWRGGACDHREESAELDLGLKVALMNAKEEPPASAKGGLVVGPDLRDCWEHRCDIDDRLWCVVKGQACHQCGERQVLP